MRRLWKLSFKSVLLLDENIYIPSRLYMRFEILRGPKNYLLEI